MKSNKQLNQEAIKHWLGELITHRNFAATASLWSDTTIRSWQLMLAELIYFAVATQSTTTSLDETVVIVRYQTTFPCEELPVLDGSHFLTPVLTTTC